MKSVCLILQQDYERDARVRRKAESLVAAGYLVDVIALRAKSRPHAARYDLNGVAVHALPLTKKRGSLLQYIYEYLIFFVLAFFKASSLMLRRRYQVVDVNTLPDFLVFSALIPRLMGAKVVLDMHEVMPEFFMSKYCVDERNWIIRLIRWQEKLSVRFADYVITINEPIQKLLESRGLSSRKPDIIMNSVNEDLFGGEIHRSKDRHDNNFILMYHGTLTYIYGLDIALHAFRTIHNEMPDAEFWIVGDGPERPGLEHLVEKLDLGRKVKFIEAVPQQDIPRWLNCCDIGVLPTRQDVFLDLSFSNKLPEYIVMGKSVITSRLKTIRHYFSEQALAYFEPHSVSELAKKMFELYKSPEQRHQLAEQARLEYEPINWNVMRQRYLSLIDNLSDLS